MDAPLEIFATVHRPGALLGDPDPYSGPDSFTFVRVQVRDSDGATGDGFTGRFLASEVAAFLNGEVREAMQAGTTSVAELMRRFNPRGMTGVVVSALSAVEIALTDLAAKRKGVSVAAHLGSRRTAAPVHVTCGFPALDTDALVEACGREVAAGARGVKVLVAAKGRSLSQDIERLTAVRAAIGHEADLIADANCGMDLDDAIAFARAIAPLNLAWLEEPVRFNDRHALAHLAGLGLLPLGAGQMEQSADRFDLMMEAGLRVIQPNAAFAGGIAAAVSTAQKASVHGCSVAPGGGWDFVNLHWVCGALDKGDIELHRAQARIARMLMPEGLAIVRGTLQVPGRPGLGLDPDEAALANCRIF